MLQLPKELERVAHQMKNSLLVHLIFQGAYTFVLLVQSCKGQSTSVQQHIIKITDQLLSMQILMQPLARKVILIIAFIYLLEGHANDSFRLPGQWPRV